MKPTAIVFTDQATGAPYKWSFWRDTRGWLLADPDGYERYLAQTWAEAVPRIRMIAENHACNVEVS